MTSPPRPATGSNRGDTWTPGPAPGRAARPATRMRGRHRRPPAPSSPGSEHERPRRAPGTRGARPRRTSPRRRAGRRGPSGRPGSDLDQQGVEDVRRRHVEEDVREVLAADEVDVVDTQVDGRHLVTGCPPGALPFHHGGQPAPQAVGGGEEGLPVGPRGVELRVEGAAGAEAPRRSHISGEMLCITGVRERTAASTSGRPSMPSPVPARSPSCGRSAWTNPGTTRRTASLLPIRSSPGASRGGTGRQLRPRSAGHVSGRARVAGGCRWV